MEEYVANYRVIIEPDQETGTNRSGYTAFVPKLGLADSGRTVEEAMENVTEGITCWIEALLETKFFTRELCGQFSVNQSLPWKIF